MNCSLCTVLKIIGKNIILSKLKWYENSLKRDWNDYHQWLMDYINWRRHIGVAALYEARRLSRIMRTQFYIIEPNYPICSDYLPDNMIK